MARLAQIPRSFWANSTEGRQTIPALCDLRRWANEYIVHAKVKADADLNTRQRTSQGGSDDETRDRGRDNDDFRTGGYPRYDTRGGHEARCHRFPGRAEPA